VSESENCEIFLRLDDNKIKYCEILLNLNILDDDDLFGFGGDSEDEDDDDSGILGGH
jgi:hypothetical protein